MQKPILMLKKHNQSLWLDNIQRSEIRDGGIKNMMDIYEVSGITSNPTIFFNSITKSSDYDEQIKEMISKGLLPEEIYEKITISDIKEAAKLFMPVFEETRGQDGFVSIELNPRHAFNVEKSITEARHISSIIGFPNVMIKVPCTKQGIEIVEELILEKINVNVTLLFSPERYKETAQAYISALEKAMDSGKKISDVYSVASFFISRIDTSVDSQLDCMDINKEDLLTLRGQAAVNVAKVTYTIFQELFSSDRFNILKEKGANIQRLLWASTGTKDPEYSDVKYIDSLIAPDTVTTLTPKTIEAFADHGNAEFASIFEGIETAPRILQNICEAGIDMKAVYESLEQNGVKTFEKSFQDLLNVINEKGKQLGVVC